MKTLELAVLAACVLPIWAADSSAEIEQLKQMLVDQQRQIDELRRELQQQNLGTARVFPVFAEPVASAAPVLPPATPAPAQAAQAAPAGPNVTELNRRVDGLIRNLGGFRFS